MQYLKELIKKLEKLEVSYWGCETHEIENFESELGSDLPECYREFLQLMGKTMERSQVTNRGFLIGNSVFFGEDLIQNNGEHGLLGLLDDDQGDLVVPDNAFVFYGSQGILYAFFILGEGDDPTVYGYSEGYEGEEFPIISDSLSQFYIRIADSDPTLFEELN